jgi:hypothetical protein
VPYTVFIFFLILIATRDAVCEVELSVFVYAGAELVFYLFQFRAGLE